MNAPRVAATRPRVLIVGAGLGGCVLAHELADTHDVTVVEFGRNISDMQSRLVDIGIPARLDLHVGSGLGGTTSLWHNALIEPSPAIFDASWPFPKSELAVAYEKAYRLLGGVERSAVETAGETLRREYRAAGLAAPEMPIMFIPGTRRNLWETLDLRSHVRLVRGEVIGIAVGSTNRVDHLIVRSEDGQDQMLDADIFVLAAGGLGTPAILQTMAATAALPALRHAGCYYEDHPMAFVGLVKLRAPLYKFWNYRAPGLPGTLRMPLAISRDGIQISFQLRPAALLLNERKREQTASVLTKLRNNPFNLANYFRLLRHPDDVLDILSFRFGIRLPTRHYSLLMVAEQPGTADRAITATIDATSGQRQISRNWKLSAAYLATLRSAIGAFIASNGKTVISSQMFAHWEDSVDTAAHHSGTARMSDSPDTGVCDRDARVHGMANLFVADGSLIPASGIANTGLTIAALAVRLADHIKQLSNG